MELVFFGQALVDMLFWGGESGNKAIVKRISLLLEDIAAHPFSGISKPEPLRYELSGKWSRRITYIPYMET